MERTLDFTMEDVKKAIKEYESSNRKKFEEDEAIIVKEIIKAINRNYYSIYSKNRDEYITNIIITVYYNEKSDDKLVAVIKNKKFVEYYENYLKDIGIICELVIPESLVAVKRTEEGECYSKYFNVIFDTESIMEDRKTAWYQTYASDKPFSDLFSELKGTIFQIETILDNAYMVISKKFANKDFRVINDKLIIRFIVDDLDNGHNYNIENIKNSIGVLEHALNISLKTNYFVFLDYTKKYKKAKELSSEDMIDVIITIE